MGVGVRLTRIFGLGLLVCLAPAGAGSDVSAAQARIAVVTGPIPPNLTLDREALRDIFLKRVVIDRSGHKLVPLNLPADDPLRAAFSEALLGKPPDALQRFWNERYFQGVSPPYVVRSEEAMLRFIAETPGALGYIAACRVDKRAHVIVELPAPPGLAAQVAALCGEGTGRP
jgi:hypothetical protein